MAAPRKGPALLLIFLMFASGAGWLVKNWPEDGAGLGGIFSAGNGFTRLDGCTLVDNRGNDGDSFHVKGPDGVERHLRLYFVDAPETGVRKYSDGNDNIKRLEYQSDYFGGLSQAEAIGAGKEAKRWVNDLLEGAQPFTVFTREQVVFGGPRIYALVRVQQDGQERWLHELLVEEGLARIYTEGTALPDGTSRRRQTRRLRELEREAKRAREGAWGLANGANGA